LCASLRIYNIQREGVPSIKGPGHSPCSPPILIRVPPQANKLERKGVNQGFSRLELLSTSPFRVLWSTFFTFSPPIKTIWKRYNMARLRVPDRFSLPSVDIIISIQSRTGHCLSYPMWPSVENVRYRAIYSRPTTSEQPLQHLRHTKPYLTSRGRGPGTSRAYCTPQR
jgi:hypothetical protein